MTKNARELRSERNKIQDIARRLVDQAEAQDRDFTQDEQREWDDLITKADGLEMQIRRLETLPDDLPSPHHSRGSSPAFLRYGLGDSEARSLCAYFKSGNRSDLGGMASDGEFAASIALPSLRSTNEIMNVTTAGDGGAAVPTGFSGQIAARKNGIDLAYTLGCLGVPGVGTTVNFPYESADPTAFVQTSEQVDALNNTYDRDRPSFNTKAFTLVKYTKKLVLTEELMIDEDANLMAFIADHIGRAIALTHNGLLLTEVGSAGTSLKTFASASTIAGGEPEDMCYNNTLSYYLDDASSVAWVMRPATFGTIKKITGDTRLYDDQAMGSAREMLLNYMTKFSSAAAAIGASGKSVFFGDWRRVGFREDPAISFLRDPYTTDGVVNLKYMFRCVFGVLQAGGIGYGVHPTA